MSDDIPPELAADRAATARYKLPDPEYWNQRGGVYEMLDPDNHERIIRFRLKTWKNGDHIWREWRLIDARDR